MVRLPLQFLMLAFAGWVNRHQQEKIEYLQEENRVPARSWEGHASGLPMSNYDALLAAQAPLHPPPPRRPLRTTALVTGAVALQIGGGIVEPG